MRTKRTEIMLRADALYDERARIENVRESIRLLEEDGQASDYEAAWRLGRALFFLGQEALDTTEAREFHARGASLCKRAVRMEEARVEGHFWLGVNRALLAGLEKSFSAMMDALSARRSLKRAVQLDSSYHGAGPLRVLARLQHKLPFLLGGSRQRARENFERAIALAPANTVTRLYFAELLLETGDQAGARRELESLLTSEDDQGWAFEQARDRRLAREMLSGMKP
jgi:tetratricopeptide (TPR) repeat protein